MSPFYAPPHRRLDTKLDITSSILELLKKKLVNINATLKGNYAQQFDKGEEDDIISKKSENVKMEAKFGCLGNIYALHVCLIY